MCKTQRMTPFLCLSLLVHSALISLNPSAQPKSRWSYLLSSRMKTTAVLLDEMDGLTCHKNWAELDLTLSTSPTQKVQSTCQELKFPWRVPNNLWSAQPRKSSKKLLIAIKATMKWLIRPLPIRVVVKVTQKRSIIHHCRP